MNLLAPRCRICHTERLPGEPWFLVIGNDWEDRIKVLFWNEALARHQGVHPACGPSHVQELVAHWMATGSLDYPFASDAWCEMGEKFSPQACEPVSYFRDPGSTPAIGELAVDRASVNRLLLENPESLAPMLEALMSALSERSPAQINFAL